MHGGLQAFRKAIGVRIKEETEIIEGEVRSAIMFSGNAVIRHAPSSNKGGMHRLLRSRLTGQPAALLPKR